MERLQINVKKNDEDTIIADSQAVPVKEYQLDYCPRSSDSHSDVIIATQPLYIHAARVKAGRRASTFEGQLILSQNFIFYDLEVLSKEGQLFDI